MWRVANGLDNAVLDGLALLIRRVLLKMAVEIKNLVSFEDEGPWGLVVGEPVAELLDVSRTSAKVEDVGEVRRVITWPICLTCQHVSQVFGVSVTWIYKHKYIFLFIYCIFYFLLLLFMFNTW